MAVCSRCKNDLDFEPLSHEVYDYIDALCDKCFWDAIRDEDVSDNWWLQPVDFDGDDFAAVNEINCD